MIFLGTFLVISGIVSIVYGVNINNSFVHQLGSVFKTGFVNPGTLYIILGIIGIIIGLVLNIYWWIKYPIIDYSNKKKCPFCTNFINEDAIVCQFCNKDVPEFIASHRVKTMKDDEYLGLRNEQNIKNNLFINISNGTEVQFLLSGNYITVDKLYAPWVKIKTKDNVRGWCFLGDLEKI